MSILSLTYHCPAVFLSQWEDFLNKNISKMVEHLENVEQYIISEVYSEMINEGKNYNILLIFRNEESREQFLGIDFQKIEQHIKDVFGEEVMSFVTMLNPIKKFA